MNKAWIIVTPVYNDWTSFNHLVQNLDRFAAAHQQPLYIVAVDDGSDQLLEPRPAFELSLYTRSVEVLHLVRNVGHQRAIATGLVSLESMPNLDDWSAVVVMDADGEDDPSSLGQLHEAHARHANRILVAARGKRQERFAFRLFYRLYKLLFQFLTGAYIDFGNYCLIPRSRLSHLIYNPHLWNHLAATIMKSKLTLERVPVDRGRRYDGQSKMNFESLIMHGLSAISVFIDVFFFRLMIVSALIALVSTLGIIVVVLIVLFTNLAIPGWATNAAGILAIILFQTVIFSLSAVFFILNQRSTYVFIPAIDAPRFIRERVPVYTSET
jgi:polyisoprenyl-phosphate glycosyltransferase